MYRICRQDHLPHLPDKEVGEAWMERFLKENTLVRKKKQGRSSLEGNQARKFAQTSDRLARDLGKERDEVLVNILPCVKALKCLNKMTVVNINYILHVTITLQIQIN